MNSKKWDVYTFNGKEYTTTTEFNESKASKHLINEKIGSSIYSCEGYLRDRISNTRPATIFGLCMSPWLLAIGHSYKVKR